MRLMRSKQLRFIALTLLACTALAGCGHTSDGFSMAGSGAGAAGGQGAAPSAGASGAASDNGSGGTANAGTTSVGAGNGDTANASPGPVASSDATTVAPSAGANTGSIDTGGVDTAPTTTLASVGNVDVLPADSTTNTDGLPRTVVRAQSTNGTMQMADTAPTLLGGVLNTAGNALLVSAGDLETFGGATGLGGLTGAATSAVNAIATPVNALGSGLASNGWSGVPMVGSTLNGVATTATNAAAGLGNVQVATLQPVGFTSGATGPVGVGILSPAAINGSLANANVASAGQLLNVGVLGATPASAISTGAAPTSLLASAVGSSTLTGAGTTGLVGASVLAPTATAGSLATASLLSGNQVANVNVNPTAVASVLNSASTAAPLVSPVTTAVAAIAAPVTNGSALGATALNSVTSTISTVTAPVAAVASAVTSTAPTPSANPVTTVLASATSTASSSSVLTSVTSTAASAATGVKSLVSGLGRH